LQCRSRAVAALRHILLIHYTNLTNADSRIYGGMLPFSNIAMKGRAIGCTAGEALCSVDLKGKNC
jgi:hypothetical protein